MYARIAYAVLNISIAGYTIIWESIGHLESRELFDPFWVASLNYFCKIIQNDSIKCAETEISLNCATNPICVHSVLTQHYRLIYQFINVDNVTVNK